MINSELFFLIINKYKSKFSLSRSVFVHFKRPQEKCRHHIIVGMPVGVLS